MKHSIVTVPRVGSHLLQQRIKQHTGVFLKKSHTVTKSPMITILRDPKELITSEYAMALFFKKNMPLDVKDLENRIESQTKLYEELIEKSSIIINYNDLVSYPYEIVKSLSVLLNLPIISSDYVDKIIDQPELGHLRSSLGTREYLVSENAVSKVNLEKMYKVHNKGLEKCLSLIKVLCFDCGGTYKVSHTTKNPSSCCPKCSIIK